jgi:hypothetical protein
MTEKSKQQNRIDEHIRDIDRRVEELDALLGRKIQLTMTSDVNNPPAMSEDEMQYWQSRREERRQLMEERDRLTKPFTIH